MKINMKEIKFGPEHVGVKVTDIISGETGVINGVESGCNYPVTTSFGTEYTIDGRHNIHDRTRRLVIGHDPIITIEEDELPQVCGVCGVEHTPFVFRKGGNYEIRGASPKCPLFHARFCCSEEAEVAIKKMTELKIK